MPFWLCLEQRAKLPGPIWHTHILARVRPSQFVLASLLPFVEQGPLWIVPGLIGSLVTGQGWEWTQGSCSGVLLGIAASHG